MTRILTAQQKERSNARAAAWRLAHPERVKEMLAIWHLAHSEELKPRMKAYHAAHRAEAQANSKAWKRAHPEKVKASNKAYNLTHPEQLRKNSQARRASKQGVPATLTIAQWGAICAVHDYRCVYCGKKAKLTQDHVLPLSKGGGTTAYNIVPACLPCNLSKGAKLPSKPVKLAMGI